MRPRPRPFSLVWLGLLLVAASCSPGSSRPRTTIPPIPEDFGGTTTVPTDVPVGGCSLAVGGSRGAKVVGPIPDTPAADVFLADDVIVELEGEPIRDVAGLVRSVQSFDVGDTVTAVVDRDGEHLELSVALVENATQSEQPMIGLLVTTLVQLITPESLPAPSEPIEGPLVRVVALENGLYLLDAVEGAWQVLAEDVPTGSWVAMSDEIYSLEPGEEAAPAVLVGLLSGQRRDLRTDDWRVRLLLAGFGDAAVALADREFERAGLGGTSVEPGLIAVDPSTGTLLWEWLPGVFADQSVAVPSFALTNPARDRTIVALIPFGDIERLDYAVFDPNGRELTGWPDRSREFLPGGAIVLGWFDDRSVLFVDSSGQALFVADTEKGETRELVAPVTVTPVRVWPVGDGRHIVAHTEDAMQLVGVEADRQSRPLTEGCVATELKDPGWGAAS